MSFSRWDSLPVLRCTPIVTGHPPTANRPIGLARVGSFLILNSYGAANDL